MRNPTAGLSPNLVAALLTMSLKMQTSSSGGCVQTVYGFCITKNRCFVRTCRAGRDRQAVGLLKIHWTVELKASLLTFGRSILSCHDDDYRQNRVLLTESSQGRPKKKLLSKDEKFGVGLPFNGTAGFNPIKGLCVYRAGSWFT